jgi:hypothetical protein
VTAATDESCVVQARREGACPSAEAPRLPTLFALLAAADSGPHVVRLEGEQLIDRLVLCAHPASPFRCRPLPPFRRERRATRLSECSVGSLGLRPRSSRLVPVGRSPSCAGTRCSPGSDSLWSLLEWLQREALRHDTNPEPCPESRLPHRDAGEPGDGSHPTPGSPRRKASTRASSSVIRVIIVHVAGWGPVSAVIRARLVAAETIVCADSPRHPDGHRISFGSRVALRSRRRQIQLPRRS